MTTLTDDPPRKSRGRPRGSKTTAPDVVTVTASRCRKCDSTEREAYSKTREFERSGVDGEGRPYSHVVWRRTRCRKCGQRRVDRSYENRPSEKGNGASEASEASDTSRKS